MLRELFPNMGSLNTLDEALKAIDCDFEAELVPVLHKMEPQPGIVGYEPLHAYRCVRRQDNKYAFSIMSSNYGLAQYKDTLSFLNDIVGNKDAEIYSAATINNGARLFIALKAPNSIVFAPGDGISCYYIAMSSHDGSSCIQLMCAPVHEKSQTIITSLDRGVIKLRHTKNVKDRLARASGIVNKMQSVWTEHANQFQKFAKLQFTDDDARTYFAMLYPSEDINEVHPRTQNIRNKLFDIYKTGFGAGLPSCKDTLLGAFVSALIFADYYKTIRTSTKGRSTKDCAVESRITGDSARLKAAALAACIQLS